MSTPDTRINPPVAETNRHSNGTRLNGHRPDFTGVPLHDLLLASPLAQALSGGEVVPVEVSAAARQQEADLAARRVSTAQAESIGPAQRTVFELGLSKVGSGLGQAEAMQARRMRPSVPLTPTPRRG